MFLDIDVPPPFVAGRGVRGNFRSRREARKWEKKQERQKAEKKTYGINHFSPAAGKCLSNEH